MEKTNFSQLLKEKGSYYLIITVLVIVAVYVAFLFYINSVAMGTKENIDPAKSLEKSRLSDLKLDQFEKTNYYKFQEINTDNYPDKLPDETPYNNEEINVSRENPFISQGAGANSASNNTAKTQKTTQSTQTAKTQTQEPAVDFAQTQQASIDNSSYVQETFAPTSDTNFNFTQEETFGAPSGEDLNNLNFNISY